MSYFIYIRGLPRTALEYRAKIYISGSDKFTVLDKFLICFAFCCFYDGKRLWSSSWFMKEIMFDSLPPSLRPMSRYDRTVGYKETTGKESSFRDVSDPFKSNGWLSTIFHSNNHPWETLPSFLFGMSCIHMSLVCLSFIESSIYI